MLGLISDSANPKRAHSPDHNSVGGSSATQGDGGAHVTPPSTHCPSTISEGHDGTVSSRVLAVPQPLMPGRHLVPAVRLNVEFWNCSEAQGSGCKPFINVTHSTPACRVPTNRILIWPWFEAGEPRWSPGLSQPVKGWTDDWNGALRTAPQLLRKFRDPPMRSWTLYSFHFSRQMIFI